MSAVDFQNASGVAPNVNADGTLAASNAAVSQNQFLNLLVTQLQNQDPLNPTDQTQMLSQLAQFSSLSEMQNLNQTLTSSSSFSQMAQSAALIGKTVSVDAADGSTALTGIVSAVSMQGGKAYLHVGNQDVDASLVSTIQ